MRRNPRNPTPRRSGRGVRLRCRHGAVRECLPRAGTGAATTAALLTLPVLLSIVLLLPGCLGETKVQGPDTAVEDLIHLLNSREFSRAYDSLAETSPYRKMTKQEYIDETERFFSSTAASFRLSNFRSEEVLLGDGTATVTWSGNWVYGFKGEEGDAVHAESAVVKESGVWKVERLW